MCTTEILSGPLSTVCYSTVTLRDADGQSAVKGSNFIAKQ